MKYRRLSLHVACLLACCWRRRADMNTLTHSTRCVQLSLCGWVYINTLWQWWYDEWDKERIGACTMGVHGGGADGGGTVFTAASTDWAHGLGGAGGLGDLDGSPDPVVEQITKNVLKKLGGAVGGGSSAARL